MGILSKIFASSTAEPITAVGNIIDQVWTSKEEVITLEIAKQRLALRPALAQTEINKVQAAHRSIFVAGARPALLWVCATGYAFAFLLNPIIQWSSGVAGPELPMDSMGELTLGMLGLAGLRTVEKIKGVSK